ncbi:MAG TPA: hypothetical protein VF026_12740 [Ktedonobacteraceae bacterium]
MKHFYHVTIPDRLTRFGQAYLDVLFESFGTTVTILEPDETKTLEADLTPDMLSLILHSLVGYMACVPTSRRNS